LPDTSSRVGRCVPPGVLVQPPIITITSCPGRARKSRRPLCESGVATGSHVDAAAQDWRNCFKLPPSHVSSLLLAPTSNTGRIPFAQTPSTNAPAKSPPAQTKQQRPPAIPPYVRLQPPMRGHAPSLTGSSSRTSNRHPRPASPPKPEFPWSHIQRWSLLSFSNFPPVGRQMRP
jgi:hypothetical protein